MFLPPLVQVFKDSLRGNLFNPVHATRSLGFLAQAAFNGHLLAGAAVRFVTVCGACFVRGGGGGGGVAPYTTGGSKLNVPCFHGDSMLPSLLTRSK